jgi:hypothetical protein
MTSKDLIRAVGEALWGSRWQTDMSDALGVGDRTVRRWAAGETEPAPGVWHELLKAIEARQAQLARVRDEIRTIHSDHSE